PSMTSSVREHQTSELDNWIASPHAPHRCQCRYQSRSNGCDSGEHDYSAINVDVELHRYIEREMPATEHAQQRLRQREAGQASKSCKQKHLQCNLPDETPASRTQRQPDAKLTDTIDGSSDK